MAESEEERHLKLTGEFDCVPEPLPTLRHSTSHVMAQAVKQLFPEVKVAIGPAIEDGFYYDFLKATPFTQEDLERIEAGMREIVAADHKFVREEMSREAAIRFFEERGEPFKVEILRGIDAPTVSLYHQGDFVDLCRGPHVAVDGRHQGRSSSCRPPAPTGAETSGTRCCSASTAPRGSRRRISTSTSGASRRPRSAITESSAASSTCS